MSFRFDAPLITGAFHFGNRGLGVLGSQVASVGTYGPGYIYNSLNLPTDANKEYQGYVVAPPGVGTFFAYEDTSFDYTGPTTSFTFKVIEDGVDLGNAQANINMPDVVAGITWADEDDVVSIVSNITNTNVNSAISWTESNDSFTVNATSTASGAISFSLDNDTFSITGSAYTGTAATIGWTEADVTFAVSVRLDQPASATINWAEVDDTFAIGLNVAQSVVGAVSWAEQSDVFTISAQVPNSVSISWTEANDSFYIFAGVPVAPSSLPNNIQVKFRNPKYKITFRRF